MNQYDIETTFAEMIRDGHTKFEFGFSLQEKDGRTMWSDVYNLSDAQDIVGDMCLTTCEGDDQTLTVWNVDYLC